MIANDKRSHAVRLTLAAAMLLATAPVANAADYEFRVTKAPNPGAAPTIQLVEAATGRVIPEAAIDVVQTAVRTPQKGVPNIQRTFIPLQAYLDNRQSGSQGETYASGELTLMATVPGELWPVWRNVNLGN